MDIILDTIRRLMEGLGDLLLSPLVTDSLYRRGFLAGVFTTVAIGWLGARLLAMIQSARAAIAAFFQPSPLPATRPGPSGYDRARGCSTGVLLLAGLLICLIVFAALTIAALLRDIPSP